MKITNQLFKCIEGWLKYKGYSDIFEYGTAEVMPTEDAETRIRMMEGEEGYDGDYLYEHLYYKHLRNFTITEKNLLNDYFNTGDDGTQHGLRVDIGYAVVNALLTGSNPEDELPTAQSIFDDMIQGGYINMRCCEEVDKGHPLWQYDTDDLDFKIDLKLIK